MSTKGMHAPRALVVYESMFGNSEKVAAAIARGLQLEGVDTALVEARSAPPTLAGDLDLLVVGGPTHAFGMSRASTMADAVRQGAPAERADVGIRDWLESVRITSSHPPCVATFDTRVTKVRWIPQAAGPSAQHLARRRGLTTLTRPAGFLVDDVDGPLVDGEVDRAVAWGRRLGRQATTRSSAPDRTAQGA